MCFGIRERRRYGAFLRRAAWSMVAKSDIKALPDSRRISYDRESGRKAGEEEERKRNWEQLSLR